MIEEELLFALLTTEQKAVQSVLMSHLNHLTPIVAVGFSSMIGFVQAQDSIIEVGTENAVNSDLVNLTSLTVNRNGRDETFSVDDLIGINVSGYDNAIETIPFEGAILGTPDLPNGPAVGNRAALLDGDNAINSGVNNPSEDEGILFSFLSPLSNGPGADFVIFEFGAAEGAPIPSDPSGNTLAPAGDPFALAGVTSAAGSPVDSSRLSLFGSDAYTFISEAGLASNIFFFNPGQGEDFSSIDVLENGDLSLITPPGATPPTSFDLTLYGALIDLDDLGFAEDEEVTTLRLLAQGPTFAIDPSFIAALPAAPVPEPSSTLLILASAIGLLGKRKR